MKKIICLLFLISTVGHAQIEKTIQKDVTQLTKIINAKDAQAFYDFLADAKDLKKIFANSDETNYDKIKFRYGQHLQTTPQQLFAEFDKKLRKYKKRPQLTPYVILYEKTAMDKEKKTVLNIFYKDANGSLYSMELKTKKISNEIFYAYKEEIEKMQQKNIDNFNKNIKPLLTNNTSEYTVINFQKEAALMEDKTYTYATLDEKPIIENKAKLSDFTKKVQTEVMEIVDPSKENKGRNRCMARLIVTKDKQLKDIKVRAATKTLRDHVLAVLQKQKVTQSGKKDGIPVDTQIVLTLMFTIN